MTGILFLSCGFLFLPSVSNINPSQLFSVFLLVPILAAEAIMAAILAAMVGYIQWGMSRRDFLLAFVFLACVLGLVVLTFLGR